MSRKQKVEMEIPSWSEGDGYLVVESGGYGMAAIRFMDKEANLITEATVSISDLVDLAALFSGLRDE